jgi:hypothetical protein
VTISTAVKINQVVEKLTDAVELLEIISRDGAISNQEIAGITGTIKKCQDELRKMNENVVSCSNNA